MSRIDILVLKLGNFCTKPMVRSRIHLRNIFPDVPRIDPQGKSDLGRSSFWEYRYRRLCLPANRPQADQPAWSLLFPERV